MLSKLKDIEKRYEELTHQLSDPEIIADRNRFQRIAKERSDLTELIEAYRRWNEINGQLNDNREMLESESDAELRRMASEEIPHLEAECAALEQEITILLLPSDPNDDKNILIEIRAGTGGEEAALFAATLFRMYTRFAEIKGWSVEVLDENSTGLGGIKEVIARIQGEAVYSALKFESGVHRVQRVPSTEASGRIHTSACTVAIMPEAEDIDVQIDEKDLRIDTYRAGGAGGQHVNKTDSAVRITHLPTGAVAACQSERSQHQNRIQAMRILKARIFEAEQRRQAAERTETRRSMVGSGDRSEKIRTYNFPQNRITDHRIGLSVHNLQGILEGDLDEIITALRTQEQAERLTNRDLEVS